MSLPRDPTAKRFTSLVAHDDLMRLVSDAVVVTDMEQRVLFLNDRAEQFYGVSADSVIGKTLSEMFGAPALSPEAEALAAAYLLEHDEWHGEAIHHTATGDPLDVDVTVTLIRDNAGNPAQMVAIMRDIRDRKRAERALQESEERFRATFEQAAVGLAHTRLDGRLIRVNRRMCDITGYSHEELIDRHVDSLTHPEDVPLDRKHRQMLIDGIATTTNHEKRYVRRDGTHCWVAITLSLQHDHQGNAVCFIAVIQDVSARKAADAERARLMELETAARQALAGQEARFRSLFEGTNDAVLAVNEKRRYVDANPAAIALLEYTKEELLEKSIDDVTVQDRAWTEAEFEAFTETGRWEGELAVRTKSGREIPVQAQARIMQTDVGPVFWSILRDLTEQRAREEFETNFLNDIAHDLKNPLSAAKAQIQLLQRRTDRGQSSPEAVETTLRQVQTSIDRMASRLDELADIARLRSNSQLELDRTGVDLVALAKQASALYQQTTDRHTISVTTQEHPVIAWCDRDRIMRVIDNLLSNAIKYSPGGGSVTIEVVQEVRSEREWAALSVVDEGVGIPESDLPIVFERFRRGGNVVRIAGTGIGLAGARQIIEQHGGTIDVQSIEGQGSRFTVRLTLVGVGRESD